VAALLRPGVEGGAHSRVDQQRGQRACQGEAVSDETVRVFLVDDHKVVRSGLAAYLATEVSAALVGLSPT